MGCLDCMNIYDCQSIQCISSVGRAIDLGSKGCYFETQRRLSHCVVFLSKVLIIESTQEDRVSS